MCGVAGLVMPAIDGYRHLKALLVALPRAKTVEDFDALLPWRIALTIDH